MSKHTPGPWKAVHRSITDQVDVFEIAEISDMRVIRDIKGDSFLHTGFPEIDARLIAAAPDLLHALNFLVDADLSSQVSGDRGLALYECANVARAAIAKATGETT